MNLLNNYSLNSTEFGIREKLEQ